MSELRQNLLTGNWTVIAPERDKRPEQSFRPGHTDREDHQDHDNTCPFCPDNETRFPLEKIDAISDAENNWLVRTIENKYKIFDRFATCPINPEPFKTQGIYSYYEGCGNHWLVIENRSHNKLLGEMEASEIYNTLVSYLNACHSMKKNPNNLIAIIFKNQGLNAGASQPHAHSQIVGSRVVPTWIRNALHVQEKHFDNHGSCVMCDIIDYEKKYRKELFLKQNILLCSHPMRRAVPMKPGLYQKGTSPVM